jgi:ADP-ribose pyrophosphatase YjhB (NUDIX family)
MYKVFVENRLVIFTQKSENYPHSLIVEASKVQDINAIVRKSTSIITHSLPLVIQCNDLETDFARIFQCHEQAIAAGGIVSNGHEILMIRKNGFWDLPKGFVDQGEHIEQGAYREISEECGISGHVMDHKLMESMHTYEYERQLVLKKSHWFLFHYSGTKETFPQRDEGILEANWIAEKDIDALFEECYGSIRDVLECYRSNVKN